MGAADEIAKYHELLKSGAISQEEFDSLKATLIGGAAKGATPANGTRGFAAVKTPVTPVEPIKPNAARDNGNRPRIQNGASPLQMGASVAAGVVGGRLIADRLLNNEQTVDVVTGTAVFADGETISAAAVEMPNGDVFYSVTDTVTYQGMLTEDQVNELTEGGEFDAGGDFDSGTFEGGTFEGGETGLVSFETTSYEATYDSGGDAGGFFDFF